MVYPGGVPGWYTRAQVVLLVHHPGYTPSSRTPRTDWCTAAGLVVREEDSPVKDLPPWAWVRWSGKTSLPSLVSVPRGMSAGGLGREGEESGSVWIADGLDGL